MLSSICLQESRWSFLVLLGFVSQVQERERKLAGLREAEDKSEQSGDGARLVR
jgi:hypothetical protein